VVQLWTCSCRCDPSPRPDLRTSTGHEAVTRQEAHPADSYGDSRVLASRLLAAVLPNAQGLSRDVGRLASRRPHEGRANPDRAIGQLDTQAAEATSHASCASNWSRREGRVWTTLWTTTGASCCPKRASRAAELSRKSSSSHIWPSRATVVMRLWIRMLGGSSPPSGAQKRRSSAVCLIRTQGQ
jgi:hypothetical protein